MSNYKQFYWIVLVALSGGIPFGLNMAGISGAVSSIQFFFNLNDNALGIVVSSLIVGCLFGAISTGYFIEKYGRKKVLFITLILFTISSLGCAFAQSPISLIISRFISGIAVGIVSVLGPVYISEISPPKKRGRLVSLHQLAIVSGILLAYVFNYSISDLTNGWRYMLAFPLIFSIPLIIIISRHLPESPRWLIAKNKKLDAFNILKKAHGHDTAKKEFKEIENSLSFQTKKISFKYIFKGNIMKIVLLGVILAIFQQFAGINAVIYYAPLIFEKTGVGENIALCQSIFIGIVNFIATLIAFPLIDSKGRKILLIWGAIGMTLTLTYISYAFDFSVNNIGILIAILIYIAFFAASFAPVFGVITSEMFSNHFRGIAMSLTSSVNWIATFVIVQFSPYILNRFGGTILFGIFLINTLLSIIFVKIWIPETKGKSLEEIERELTD